MTAKNYFLVTGVIFAVITVLHIIRLVNGLPFVVGTVSVPTWVSVIGVVLPGFLAIWAFKLKSA